MRPIAVFGVLAFLAANSGVTAQSGADRSRPLFPFGGPVTKFAVSHDAAHVLTIGEDGRVLWTRAAAAKSSVELVRHSAQDGRVGFSGDGKLAAYVPWGAFGDDFVVFRTDTGERLTGWTENIIGKSETRRRSAERDAVCAARLWIHPSGARLFVPGEWGRSFHLASESRFVAPTVFDVHEGAVSSDGKEIAVIEHSGFSSAGDPMMKVRRMSIMSFSVDDAKSLNAAAWEQRIDDGEPYFSDVSTFDFSRLAFLRRGCVEVEDFAPNPTPIAKFGESASAITGDGAGGYWIGKKDGTIEHRAVDGKLLSQMTGRVGAIKSLRADGEFVVARCANGHEVFRLQKSLAVLENAYETTLCSRTGVFCMRAADGTANLYLAGALVSRVKTDRPFYPDSDPRILATSIQNGIFAAVIAGRLNLIDVASGKTSATIGGHFGAIDGLAWSGSRLVVRGRDTSVLIDSVDGSEVSRSAHPCILAQGRFLPIPDSPLREIGRFVAHGDWIAGYIDRELAIVRDGDFKSAKRMPSGGSWDPVAFSPNGRRLAYVRRISDVPRRTAVEVVDIATGATVFSARNATIDIGNIQDIAFSPDGQYLVVDHRGASVFGPDGKEIVSLPCGPAGMGRSIPARGFDISPDSRLLVAASFGGAVNIFDLVDKKVISAFNAPDDTYSHFAQVRFDRSGRRFLLAYPERDIAYVGDVERGLLPQSRMTAKLSTEGDSFDFLPDGSIVLLTEDDVEVRSGENFRVEKTYPLAADRVSVANDGKKIAFARGATLTIVDCL